MYFITICTYEKIHLFGDVVGGKMILNDNGHIAQEEWLRSSKIRNEIEMDEFVIMPNHVHGIIIVNNNVRATGRSPLHHQSSGPPKRSLGSFVAGFKSSVTKRINEYRNTPTQYVWQRNYYDHIIRNDVDLNRTRQYILNNPEKWELDRNHPDNL